MTEATEHAGSKPLWRRFYQMSEAGAAAEMAEDRRRMESGEMTGKRRRNERRHGASRATKCAEKPIH